MSSGQVAMPEVVSVQVKWTVGAVAYQPSASAVPITEAVIDGAMLSTSAKMAASARLPALSTPVIVSSRPRPSPWNVWSGLQEAMPETGSWQSTWTVGAVRYHSAALASTDRWSTIDGIRRSRLTVAVAVEL